MFSRMRSLNRKVSWGTNPIFLRSDRDEIVADGAAVDQNRSRFRVVDARDQAYERGLARSRGTDNCQTAACGHAQVQVVQNRLAFITEVQPAEFDLAGNLAILRARSVLDLGLLLHDFIDSNQRRGAALEDVDDPAESDDRPGELHHVGAERDELADAHRAGERQRGRDSGSWDSEGGERSCRIRNQRHGGESVDDFAAAEPQHQNHSATQHEFERGPEHAHEAHQAQAAADVFLVLRFEGANLGIFLHVGADQARSGKVFLGARGDVGEHGLNSFEAIVNAPAEGLDHDAHGGQRQECVEREPGADRDHEGQRARGVDEGVGGVHDRRSEEHADRVQVVGGAGHDVARAVALVVGVGQAFEPGEEIVAKVEFDVAGNADDDPARQELEDPFGDGEGEQACRRRPGACGGSRRCGDRRRPCQAPGGRESRCRWSGKRRACRRCTASDSVSSTAAAVANFSAASRLGG